VLLGEIIENRGETMDFMFEDDVDEVGSDVEAYCPKCKADTTHVVISKYEDEIRRVQCNPCGDVHSFRKPRGEAEEEMPEPVAARKRALLKKASFEEFFAKHSDRNAKSYEFRETYKENNIVVHPKFGKGFISEVVSESKVEVTFADARRILVHNRKDIPGSPVGAEDDGLPSNTPVAKPAKKETAKAKAAKAVPAAPVAVVASPAEAPKGEVTKPEKAPEAKAEKKPEKKIEKKPEAKAEKKPEVKAEVKAEKKPEKKVEKKPEAKAEKKPEKKAEKKPEKKTEKKPEKKAEKKPEKKTEKKPEKKAEKKIEKKPAKKIEKKPAKKHK